ncbi:class I SAM-dependent methyltransferase [Polynucleobacter yangtzensis]|nr:methyltransferase domain-containing protein [Polynucleobacter yangtzensis]
MKNSILGKRFFNDGHEIVVLTDLQRRARDSIYEKMLDGRYVSEVVKCPLCDGNSHITLSEKDFYGLPVKTVICRNCSMIYANPRLSRDALVGMYANEYRDLDRVHPTSGEYFELEIKKAERIAEYLTKNGVLSKLNDKLIIEIGCGAGGALHHFKKLGFNTMGCDLSPRNVEYGVSRGLDIRYGDIDALMLSLDFNFKDIGLVIYEQVFEHLSEPKLELERLHGLLPKNSFLYIGVPGIKNIANHYGSDFLRFLQLPHLCHFELRTLVKLVQSTGFSFLCGDESARAIFSRSGVRSLLPVSDSNYLATIEYLRILEIRRKVAVPFRRLKEVPIILGMGLASKIRNSRFIPQPIKSAASRFLKFAYHQFFK